MSAIETATLRPGYEISRLIKGGWQLATGHSETASVTAIDEMTDYVRAGVTAFDCADIYTGVEEKIGDFRRAAKASGNEALIAPLKVHTKCVPDFDKLATIRKADVEATIDRSLKRLSAERLDLVQFHWWDTGVKRYVEVASWLSDFQKAGKIDLVGTTNFNTDCMEELVSSGYDAASIQLQFSLLDRRPTKRMVDYCAANNIKILCYGTVAGGFLSDKWLGVAEPTGALENRSLVKYKLIIDDMGGWDAFQSLLATLRAIAEKHGVDIASVAMRAMLVERQVAGIIVGVRHGGHLGRHAKLFDLVLDADDHAKIDAALAEATPLEGDVYDLERDKTGRHGSIMKYNLNAD